MTIKDIARLSGCGVATVSRVLNNYPDVSDATRERVMAVVKKYNFQPNSNARHLKQQNARNVAIIVKGTHNMLFADLVEMSQEQIRKKGKDAMVYYLDEDANEVVFALRVCREYKPLAILFLGGDLDHFRRDFGAITIPCVLLTNHAEQLGFHNLSSITTDDAAAAEEAVDYLIGKHHTNVGIVGGNWSSAQIGYQRILGCSDSFQKHGIPFDAARQCEPCRFSMADAYAATERLLDRNPELTAIFAISDVMAIGVIRALYDRGYRVPEDISVMGYDGLPIGEFSTPRLTTIRQDGQRMALRGTEILLERLERKLPPCYETAPFLLVEGESVADSGK